MLRTLLSLLGGLAGLSFLALSHWYVWSRIFGSALSAAQSGQSGGAGWKRFRLIFVVVGTLIMPAIMGLTFLLPRAVVTPVALAGYLWLGFFFYGLLLVAGLDLLKLGYGLVARLLAPRSEEAQLKSLGACAARGDLARERRPGLWMRCTGVGVCVVAAAIGLGGLYSVAGQVMVKQVPVTLERLPGQWDGFRLVLLSDLHVGPILGKKFVEGVVERVNELKPDLIAITGDLVDGSVDDLGEQVLPLARLRARFGTWFVTGNHEYYSGVHGWVQHLNDLGVKTLINERVTIGGADEAGEAKPAFDLVGLPDWSAGRHEPAHHHDLPRALDGLEPGRESILLAHQPKHIRDAAAHGVGLQLSGHTHGGQMWPFGALVKLDQPYLKGLYRHRGTRTQIYVSPGTGFWGPPMRVLAPAEITLLILSPG